MHHEKSLLPLLLLLHLPAWGHGRIDTVSEPSPPPPIQGIAPQASLPPGTPGREELRIAGKSLQARILALIAKGEFAEAQVLITEGVKIGTLSQQVATRLQHKIALLSTKLGEIPARLQRAPDFPSQLRDHTLFQIENLLKLRDFSLATEAQLKLAIKLIEQQPRLIGD